MLEVAGVNQFYGESHILWDMALTVPEGGCTCLMGRNGVGKTTLLKTIMGLVPKRSGEIRFGGGPLGGRPAHQRARIGIGYVPQGRDIFPQLTVEENLRVGLGVSAKYGSASAGVSERIFALFPVLKDMLRRRGGDLSGGQQQQLAIGRALALEPRLLILDEPTEGIQPNIVHQIGDVILRLNRQEGLTVLLVEQKLPFARRIAKDFCIMEKGRAVAAGPMAELNEGLIKQHLSV
jgi:urea transport system ATP-binding protein